MHNINRYNQGFGGFGPLEQCKDGKLCKVAEVEPLLDTLLAGTDALKQQLATLEQDNLTLSNLADSQQNKLAELYDQRWSLLSDLSTKKLELSASLILNVVAALSFIIPLVFK